MNHPKGVLKIKDHSLRGGGIDTSWHYNFSKSLEWRTGFERLVANAPSWPKSITATRRGNRISQLDLLKTLKWTNAELAQAKWFGFPRAHSSQTVDDRGISIPSRTFSLHELAQWIDKARALVPQAVAA